MNPTVNEIEYAKEQIEEANRRLSTVQERIGRPVPVYILKPIEEDVDDAIHTEIKIQGGSHSEFSVGDELKFDDATYNVAEEVEPDYEVDNDLVSSHIQNIVIDCQLCIEISVKAMFKLTSQDHPFSHGISFQSGKTQGFYSKIPDEFDEKEEIVRVIFLTQFWEEFYELSKYGAPQLNVRPESIFTAEDGIRAVEDAEYCIQLAESLLDYAQSKSI